MIGVVLAVALLASTEAARPRVRIVEREVVPADVVAPAPPLPQDWPAAATVLASLPPTGPPVLLEFHQEGCPHCRRLRTDIYAQGEIQAALRAVPHARVESTAAGAEALVSRFGVRLFPTLLLIDRTGTVLRRLEGMPGLPAVRELLAVARTTTVRAPSGPASLLAAGDLAADAGAPAKAAALYRQALTSGAPPGAARLRLGRALETSGDLVGAALVLDTFTGADERGPELRPALEMLLRIQRALGDRAGEARAAAAFARAFPQLPRP